MSNHDRSNHDRRIMSENPGVYIAMKSAVNFFAMISIRPVTYKKGILVGAEERGPSPRSDRDGRIYRLAVPILK